MKRIVGTLLALGLLFGAAAAALAQDDTVPVGPPPIEEISIVSVDRDVETGEVEVVALAPAALVLGGREIPGSSVRVLVNGEIVAAEYESVAADQLEVLLVLDISGSMAGPPIAAAKDAALSFVRAVPAAVDLGVVSFDDEVFVSAPLGSESEALSTAISQLAVGGDTAMNDAMLVAVSQFGPPNPSSQRVIVLLTDGTDDGSTATIDDATIAIAESGIDVYAVALGSNIDAGTSLQPFVEPTNGAVLQAANAEALRPLYDGLAAQLASQFTIRFTPADDAAGTTSVLVDHLGVLAGATVGFDAFDRPEVPTPATQQPRAADVVEPRAPLTSTVVGTASWASSKTALYIGAGLVSLLLLGVGLWLSFPSERMVQLATASRSRSDIPQVSGLTERLEGMADRALEKRGKSRAVASALERAGLDLRPAEFVVIAGCIALSIGLLLWLFAGVVAAVIGVVGSFFSMRAWVSYKARKRSEAFVTQLPQTLQLLAGSLRAGHALPQAAETVATEAESPTGDEFHRLTTEHRLGRDFSEALGAMDDRVGSEDFSWVVQAIEIHREVGGDLAEVLDNVNGTIRDRNFIRRQFQALSAEGRYSAYLIVSLPFIVVLILSLTNPDYIGQLFSGTRGWITVFIALGLVSIGSLWMRQLMKVKF